MLMDFLRVRLTDPRARISSNTETLIATAGQTVFVLTPPTGALSAVTSVTVNSVAKTKWVDYYPSTRAGGITFFTGLTVADSVVIVYKYGTNWIHTGKVLEKLNANQYPRIGLQVLSSPGIRLGNYQAPIETTILFSVDLWAKEKGDGQQFTISGLTYYGEELLNYLAMQINTAFISYESDLHPAMYNYSPNQTVRDLPFDEIFQAHHKVCEISLKSINIGQI